MYEKEWRLYKKTADGDLHRQSIYCRPGSNSLRIFRSSAWKDSVVEYEEPCLDPSSAFRTAELIVNELQDEEGWDFHKLTAEESIPTLTWSTWPKHLVFGRAYTNPNVSMLGEGPFLYFEAVPGQALIVVRGSRRVVAYNLEQEEVELHLNTVSELMRAYPEHTVLRGVLADEKTFVTWDVPFRDGKDCITFVPFSKRRPKYDGLYVKMHQEILDPEAVPIALMVDPEVIPGGTAYTYEAQPTFIRGTWILRSTL